MLSSDESYSGKIHSFDIGQIKYDDTNRHHSFHAIKNYEKGELIISFSASSIQENPDRFTVQINENKHIVLEPDYLKYLNHSCDPNCFVDVDHLQLIALKPILKEEELNFFYPSTEWDMSEPFQCQCATAECLQKIKGAAHIPLNTLKKYRLSSFIEQKMKAQ
ncbi:MAG: SET domain-containing protein-lysine N-methyltransferase [Bacteroidota bacterium]|jgi:hypothetical protein